MTVYPRAPLEGEACLPDTGAEARKTHARTHTHTHAERIRPPKGPAIDFLSLSLFLSSHGTTVFFNNGI